MNLSHSSYKWMLLTVILFLFCLPCQAAGLKVANILGSNMVLQQQMPVRIWGWAATGDEVTVEFAGQHKTIKAGENGAWKLELDPMPASAEPRTLKISAKGDVKPIELTNVLVGEVWVCSGQSNMGVDMHTLRAKAPADFTEALPNIRCCTTPFLGAYSPQADLIVQPGANLVQWNACETEMIPYVSATAFYFARELYRHLKVPVGIVVASIGGTPVEAWAPRSAFEKDNQTCEVLQQWEKQLTDAFPDGKENFDKYQKEWLERARIYSLPTGPYGQWLQKVREASDRQNISSQACGSASRSQ